MKPNQTNSSLINTSKFDLKKISPYNQKMIFIKFKIQSVYQTQTMELWTKKKTNNFMMINTKLESQLQAMRNYKRNSHPSNFRNTGQTSLKWYIQVKTKIQMFIKGHSFMRHQLRIKINSNGFKINLQRINHGRHYNKNTE